MGNALQSLDGALVTEEVSAEEAVLILWLQPGEGSALKKILSRHAILAGLHLSRKSGALSLDACELPVLSRPDGGSVRRLPLHEINGAMQKVLERVKARLKSQQDRHPLLGAMAGQLYLTVFETGSEPVGPGWNVGFAGRRYALGEGD